MKEKKIELEEFTVSSVLLGSMGINDEAIKQFTRSYSKSKGCYYTSFKKVHEFETIWTITNRFDPKVNVRLEM